MPFCPQCRAEYNPGIKHCKDCNVSLVDALIPSGNTEQVEEFICSECGEDVSPGDACCPKCGVDFRDEDEEDILISTQHKSPNKSNHINITACKVYLENAFRILGVAGNSTLRKVREAQQELATRARVGGLTSADDPLSGLGRIELNEATIRDAFIRLKDPKTRLYERLFWFSNNTTADEEALAKLAKGDMQGAILRWSDDKNITSIANLARIHHINCIVKDPEALHAHLWEATLAKWAAIFKSEVFWEQFMDDDVDAKFEPPALRSDFEELREQSWMLVLQPTVKLIGNYLTRGISDVGKRHLILLRESGYPSRILISLEGNIYEPLETEIEQVANKIQSELDEIIKNTGLLTTFKKDACDKAQLRLKTQLIPKLDRIIKIAGSDSEVVSGAKRIVATCLRNVSITYHNEFDAYDLAEELLQQACELAKGTSMAERYKEDLKIAIEHVDNQRKYNLKLKLGSNILLITPTIISLGNTSINVNQITGIRYGVYSSSFNFIPVSRSYAFWLTDGTKTIEIECARGELFSSSMENRFNQIRGLLFDLVQKPMAIKMIADFESGEKIYISGVEINYTGWQKNDKFMSWYDYNGYSFGNGYITISKKKSYGAFASFNFRSSWNAVNLSILLDYLNKEGKLWEIIGKFPAVVKVDNSRLVLTKDKGTGFSRKKSWAILSSLFVIVGIIWLISSFYVNKDNPSPLQEIRVQITSNQQKQNSYESELNQLQDSITTYRTIIEQYALKIKLAKSDQRAGLWINKKEYREMKSQHNTYVELHNSELRKYKAKKAVYELLLKTTNEDIDEYNKLIRER